MVEIRLKLVGEEGGEESSSAQPPPPARLPLSLLRLRLYVIRCWRLTVVLRVKEGVYEIDLFFPWHKEKFSMYVYSLIVSYIRLHARLL